MAPTTSRNNRRIFLGIERAKHRTPRLRNTAGNRIACWMRSKVMDDVHAGYYPAEYEENRYAILTTRVHNKEGNRIKSGNYLSFAFVLCTTLNLPFIRRNGISKYLYDSEAIPIVRVDIDIKITMDATSFCINSAS